MIADVAQNVVRDMPCGGTKENLDPAMRKKSHKRLSREVSSEEIIQITGT